MVAHCTKSEAFRLHGSWEFFGKYVLLAYLERIKMEQKNNKTKNLEMDKCILHDTARDISLGQHLHGFWKIVDNIISHRL